MRDVGEKVEKKLREDEEGEMILRMMVGVGGEVVGMVSNQDDGAVVVVDHLVIGMVILSPCLLLKGMPGGCVSY